MILLQVEGDPRVLAVRLDDPSPGYAERYARTVARYLEDPRMVEGRVAGADVTLRWCEVDVLTVAEHGPDDVARFLTGDYTLDIPQTWETLS